MKPDEASIDAIARTLFRAHEGALPAGAPMRDFDALETAYMGGRPVIEGWRAAACVAIELGARLHSEKSCVRLAELLGSDSTNFLGSGLTMREFVQLGNAEKMAASWSNQSCEECRRRLGTVMRLSVELAHVRETTMFSTRLAELAIEAVIDGDWKMIDEWARYFAFVDDEDEDLKLKYAPVFAVFRELLLQAERAAKEVSA